MSPYSRLDDAEAESPPMGEPNAFLEEALFKARTILLTGGIDFKQAKRVCERLLALSSESDKPILLVISSPGGHVESGDMIHDMIKFIKPKVWIIATGWAASAGSLIFVAVPKERRLALPNTRFLMHQPSGGTRGMASDIEIQAREIIKMNERLIKIYAKATGQSQEKIAKDIDRDYWLSAEDAVAYGLVGRIIESHADIG